MIPRYQKIVFFVLLVVSIAMAAVLVRLRERAHERLLRGEDFAPTTAPAVAPAEKATLLVANDMDGTLVTEEQSLPLPVDAEARARALLEKLLELYASPGSLHPVPGVPRAVEQVFLLSPAPKGAGLHSGQLAVVNLAGAFADGHPAGIEAETLTVLSICGTLHANLPQITEVRFLVNGAPRKTLAGHADLTRTYLTTEAESTGTAGDVGAGARP
ncbi:GerMN domain-containing protein [Acidicapsa ligni]|uniref:GerMN domain-containing protein n=1 Tax=Acidicapsa ligni TaxID=542300 RepID=UPI0021E0CA1A|nr:GerMN domain-containing protein [Acidicapsa ligni]